MKNKSRNISGGIYVVADPATDSIMISALQKALDGGIDIIQIWNHWLPDQDKHDITDTVCRMAAQKGVPVLINDDWQLLTETALDGVHFDHIPVNMDEIRRAVKRPFLAGITCGNDLDRVQWAIDNNMDYISFCSMFPSVSAGVCEIVTRETVRQARQMTDMPIFLAGGISVSNLDELSDTGYNGIAVISSVMQAEDPAAAAKAFKQKLISIQHEK
jgi:thiamine-phosphate pyrophosphorylase